VEERTIDVHIRRLRRALEDFDCDQYIQTVRGAGYRFSVRVDA
jgi:two-component system phosphate regulon response regulator PhoB